MSTESTSFSELNLVQPLLKALEQMNFITPSPIQAQTIPYLLEGRDVIAQAQTGTGKTAAFALPILQQLNLQSPATQALILAPTRELAIQVSEQFELLSACQNGVRVSVLCGGQDYRRQLTDLRAGAQIVVGTPGRILDHIDRGSLKLDQLQTFVLDEADEMLRMGFIEDVELILSKLPDEKRMALFSATMPTPIRKIATRYLKDPVLIEIYAETATVKSIEQRFLFASQAQKPDALLRILAVEDYQGIIVFVRTKNSTEEVATVLQQQGYRAMALNGDITQTLRERIIAQFRQGSIDILVATDVAARGLDVERVTHVINYDVPHDSETYVHRIGRTGRAGRSGVTILFVTPRESRILNNIERHTRQRIEKIIVPNDYMIQKAKQERFIANVLARLSHTHLSVYKQVIDKFAQSHPEISLVDIAAAIALMMNQDKPWHTETESQSSNPPSKSQFIKSRPLGGRRNKQTLQAKQEQVLFRLAVGRVHGVKPGNIVGAIANEAGLQSCDITELKIHTDYSTVYLPKDMSKKAFQNISKARVCGRLLQLTVL